MARRFSVALVLLVFMALLLPGNLLPTNRAEAQEPPRDSKISGLLALQVEGKRQAVRAGRLPATVRPATAEVPQQGGLIDTFQPQAAGLADLTRQQIFLHLAQKPTQSQIAELQADNVTLHLDSWIPPVGNHPTGFILADMPVDKLETLAGRGYVARMETAERLLEEQNDLAAQKINADDVWASGYDGAGVKIAVLDSGLDLTHPDFPTPVAKKDYSNYPALDDNVISPVSGHGTHVTGSALGRGTQSGGVYKGSAPGADLIFLKVGRDDGSIPLSAITNAIRDAVDVYNADVITMSIGGWDTYHDGTGEDAQAVDYAFSQGAVVLIAAGNESNDSQHYSGTVAGGSATDFISVNVTGAGTNDTSLQFNLVWFDGTGVSNDLVMEYYNSAQTLVASTNLAQSQSSRGTESELSYYNLYVPAGNSIWYLKVRNNSSNSQFFHIYYDLGGSRVKFDSPDVNYTITSPSDADSAIAVGAYTTRKVWYDYANNGWQSASETVDQIATFSSRGPRVDTGAPGKPNIVAPGKNIISTRDNVAYPWANRGTYYVDNDGPNRSNASGGSNDSNGPADYYVMGGTSMATPIAAGVAALILQKNPGWTPAQVKNALESTATDKGTTGWDGTYGWGLVNALAAVTEPTSVTTGNATNITSNSASLSGNLTSLGSASSANVSFDWGTTSGSLIYETAHITTNLTGSFSANITGLSANTTYYFRAKAVGDGTSYGNTANFTTLPVIPLSVVTNNATNITTNSVRLNGNLTSLGSASSANVSFVFGTGPGVYTFETQIVSLSFTGSFSINVTGLSPNTYYFRAKAAGDGTAYGNELSFNIPVPTPPTVVTTNATNITTNSARVSGNLTSLGSASSANVSFDWGTTSGSLIYETANITTNLTGSFSANITGLSANTTYYFRAKAVGDGTSYGTTDNFTTLAPSPPVANDDAAMTDEDTAVSIAVLANDSDVDGDLLVTTVNITAGPANGQASVNSATGSVTYTPAANFYGTDNFTYRVSDTSGLFDTATVTITVFSVNDPPVARDDAVTTNEDTTVSIAVTANDSDVDGNLDVTTLAVTAAPSNGLTVVNPATGSVTYTPAANFYGTDNFTYRVSDTAGAGDFAVVTVTVFSVAAPPSVTTNNATSIGVYSARLSGNLTALGPVSSVNLSFLWGTPSGNLTIETEMISMTLPGAFSANITGLSANTTYYFRAKGVGDGAVLGNEKSFTTLVPVPPQVTTNNATNIGPFSATLSGNLTSLGTASSTNVSFRWGAPSGNLTFETELVPMTLTGVFSANLTGLSANTTYYFRARAQTDGHGSDSGVEESFTTLIPVPPTVSTNNATSVTYNSARLNGMLGSLGTVSSANVSFLWGTASGSLTNETSVQAKNATGDFSIDLASLSPSTTYYFRAKASGHGTVSGNETSFTTLTLPPPPLITSGGGGGGGGGGAASGGGGGGGGGGPTISLNGLSGTLQLGALGHVLAATTLGTSDGKLSLDVAFSTRMLGADNQPVASLTVEPSASLPTPPPLNAIVLAYDLGPSGTTLSPPITLSLKYDPAKLPSGADENSLTISYWDGSQWENLATTVDAESNTASAPISHFSTYALLTPLPATASPPQPTPAPPITAPAATQAPAISPPPASAPTPEPKPEVLPESQAKPSAEPAITPPPVQAQEQMPEQVPGTVAATNWWLIGGIVAGVVILGLLLFLMMRRRA